MARATRIALDLALGASKAFRTEGQIAWQYLKVESVPPMTMATFNGPTGEKLEIAVSNVMNGFINAIEGKIQEMDAEEERVKREKEAAIQAAQEKAKAEELKKKQEAEKKAMEIKMAKEEAAAKKEEESKKAEEKKKTEKQPAKAKKPDPKKKK